MMEARQSALTDEEARITSKVGKQIVELTPGRRKRLAEMIDTLLMVESIYTYEKEQAKKEG